MMFYCLSSNMRARICGDFSLSSLFSIFFDSLSLSFGIYQMAAALIRGETVALHAMILQDNSTVYSTTEQISCTLSAGKPINYPSNICETFDELYPLTKIFLNPIPNSTSRKSLTCMLLKLNSKCFLVYQSTT
jgi:hypothetical protein